MKKLRVILPDSKTIPNDLGARYPELESLDLSQNQLDESALEGILNLITTLPKLQHLNISQNQFPFQALMRIFEAVEEHNPELMIETDYSHWLTTFPEQNLPPPVWALSPKQWENETDTEELLTALTQLFTGSEDHRDAILNAICENFKLPNKNGWSTLSVLAYFNDQTILTALISRQGLDWFTQKLRGQVSRDLKKVLEDRILFLLPFYLSSQPPRYELATQLVNTFLSPGSAAEGEALGLIAYNRKDCEQAYLLFTRAAMEERITALYNLAMMRMEKSVPALLPFDLHQTVLELEKLLSLGVVCAGIDLQLLYEGSGNLGMAFAYHETTKLKLAENPGLLQTMHPTQQETHQRFTEFHLALCSLLSNLFEKRASLTQTRYQAHSPLILQRFNKEHYLQKLNEMMGNLCLIKIIEGPGPFLMKRWLANKNFLTELGDHLCEKVTNASELGKGLLSIEPDIFSQNLIQAIGEYHQAILLREMRSGHKVRATGPL